MKKPLSRILAALLSVSLLLALGGCTINSTSNGANNTSDPHNEVNMPSSQGETSMGLVANASVDLTDSSAHFIEAHGIKYDLNTTIQAILDDGYTVDFEEAELTVEVAAESGLDAGISLFKDGQLQFTVYPINRSAQAVPLAECTLWGLELVEECDENTSIVGGLSIGSTLKEVEEIFGTDIYMNMAGFVVYLASEEIRSFFTFTYNEDEKVSAIFIENRSM